MDGADGALTSRGCLAIDHTALRNCGPDGEIASVNLAGLSARAELKVENLRRVDAESWFLHYSD